MSEMAAEYRLAAAKLAMRIQEKRAAGADPMVIQELKDALRDIREIQRVLDGYYELPRPEGPYTMNSMRARRSRDDH